MPPDDKKRLEAEKQATDAVSKAKVKLLLGQDARSVFFATLALRLDYRIDWSISTAATDGKRLWYNPAFINSLTQEQVQGLVVHEVLHCSNCHQARRGARDPRGWNIACDLAINYLITEAGFKLPSEGCFPGKGDFKDFAVGLSSEEYYHLLQQNGGGSGGKGEGDDPGGCGAIVDPEGGTSGAAESEATWKVATIQAANLAKQRGKLPAGLDRLVEESATPKVPWRDVLREFVRSFSRNDYSWSPPNRRFVHQGLYLPSLRSEELGDVMIAVDTSGSIGQEMLDRFAAEVTGILEAYDCKVTVVYCDCAINGVETWQSSDGPMKLTPKGGGGTDHKPVWEWAAKEGYIPTCCVALTDNYTDHGEDPGYPVLWAITGDHDEVPWGRVVSVD